MLNIRKPLAALTAVLMILLLCLTAQAHRLPGGRYPD